MLSFLALGRGLRNFTERRGRPAFIISVLVMPYFYGSRHGDRLVATVRVAAAR
jgi:hypothetical protein